jgi:hypothetical protein
LIFQKKIGSSFILIFFFIKYILRYNEGVEESIDKRESKIREISKYSDIYAKPKKEKEKDDLISDFNEDTDPTSKSYRNSQSEIKSIKSLYDTLGINRFIF